MSQVNEALQQLAALAEANDGAGVNALIEQTTPGELDEITEQLRALGKAIKPTRWPDQAAAGDRRADACEREIAINSGLGLERYAEMKGRTR